ncbi:MAG: hypothetical protein ACI8RD_003697 [Bacillariaceae sp.]|jgi:hypothetical protein
MVEIVLFLNFFVFYFLFCPSAQPLISRVNFSNCHLAGGDLTGLLHGLARIWCGGTALAESICFAKKENIPTKTWDLFFQTFADPSTLSNT